MDSNKLEATSHIAQNAGASLTGLAWLWSWLGTNHDAITSVCAILGFAIALTGFMVNTAAKRKTRSKK